MLGRIMMRLMRLPCLHLVLIELLIFPFMCGAAGLGSIFLIVVMVRGILVVVVSFMRARVAVILMVRLLIRGRRGFLLIGQVLKVLLMVVFSFQVVMALRMKVGSYCGQEGPNIIIDLG